MKRSSLVARARRVREQFARAAGSSAGCRSSSFSMLPDSRSLMMSCEPGVRPVVPRRPASTMGPYTSAAWSGAFGSGSSAQRHRQPHFDDVAGL